MTEFFLHIYSFLRNHKWFRISLLVILLGVMGICASKISLEEDISGFMPNDKNSEKINFVYKNIQIADKIIIRFSTKNADTDEGKEKLAEAAEVFAGYIDSATENKSLVKEMFYKVNQEQIFEVSNFITQNIPYFLEESDYQHIDSILQPDKIYKLLENNKKILVSPAGMILKKNTIADPLHLSGSTLLRLKNFQVSDQYEDYNDYIFSKKGNHLMFFITSAHSASETAKNKDLVAIIDSGVQRVSKQFNHSVNITYFGSAPIAVTNAEQIKKDSYISIIIAVILILSLLFWFFRSFKSIILIAVPVVFGALLSLAALYFVKGTISAIAIGAGSVIFGIAISYSLHFLIHAKHEQDVSKVIKDLASPMVTGSITTIGAFLSLLFISADSMRDFGLFAAFSLIGTLFFVLIFMPHLIQKTKIEPEHTKQNFFDKITGYRYEKNQYILLGILVLTALFFVFSFGVSFESDMNKINFMKSEQRKAFNEISDFTTLGKKNVYYVAEGKTIETALREYEKQRPVIDSLHASGEILQTAGVGAFLPSDSLQKIKIERWNSFWATRKESLKKNLLEQGHAVGFKEQSFDLFFNQLDQTYTVQPTSFFSIITNNFVKDYLIQKNNRAAVITVLYTTPEKSGDVSKTLTKGNSFVFDSESFSKSLLSVLSTDFNTVLYLCSFLVLAFLTISFGRLELSLISFLPMAISWIWILGIMSMFDIRFNIVNIILATFIFGLGDDYTIFMMDGMMNEYGYKRKLLASYKQAVALSAITMFIGIGSLVFAKHPAMRSLANVTIIGMISVVIISYVIPPLLYSYITTKKGKKRLIPVTFTHSFATIYSFLFFLAGSFGLTVYGFTLLGFRKKTEKRRLKYHKALFKTSRFVVKHLPLVQTKIENKYKETFEKPGIIICNHQSHLDLMFVLMLSPKIVVLTNEWVWNSPFYGKLIRYADFYPVMNGIENSIEKLASIINKGYSVAIFPEGTRSEDCSILRFHRGAFFLAEQLNVDIIPLIVHGIGHALPKSELLLRRGKITMEILERISPENKQFGENYTHRTKQIRQLYKREYSILQQQCETPAYYHSLVYHNYIYKGAGIEKYAKHQLKQYENFEKLINLLPNNGTMLNPFCAYGVFVLMCSLVKKDLQIIAFDVDEDKIALASNCASLPNRVQFNTQPKNIAFDFITIINPDNIEMIEPFIKKDRPMFILVDKKNKNYEMFMSMENLCLKTNSDNYTILAN